jgi:protein-tyrosine-phosphatase
LPGPLSPSARTNEARGAGAFGLRCDDPTDEWPQSREQIRWHFDDPAEATGSEEERLRVFRRVRNEIQRRLSLSMLAAKVPVTLLKAGRHEHGDL